MQSLNIVIQPITNPHVTNQPFHHHNFRAPPPPRTWRLHAGPKGFTGSPKDKQSLSKTRNQKNNDEDDDDDDKIPEVVWGRMIPRILFYVGFPLATGLLFLQVFSVLKGQGLWDVPKWVPFLTSFVTFGASALGVAFGSLSTSLDAETEGSLLGFEQVEKNWGEMWKEDEEEGSRNR